MKTVKKVARSPIGRIALTVGGSLIPGVGPAVGAALGGAAGGALSGGGLKGAAIGAATGYAGNVLGSSIGSSLTSGLAKAGASNAVTNSLANSTIGRLASNVAGPVTGSSLIGGAIGKYAGNSIADSLSSSLFPVGGAINAFTQDNGLAPENPQPEPFSPKQDAQLSLPGSLTQFGSLDPNQQSSNLATQGVYGGGLGPEEDAYFRNLINRRLVDQSGAVDPDLSEVNPIEMSYLSQRGISGNNPTSILEALSKYGQGSYATA